MSGHALAAGGVPVDVLYSHIGIVGKAGSGKSYTARLLIEHLIDQEESIVIVDPTGVYHGLKWTAAGEPWKPCIVFGGDHADVAIDPTVGEKLGEICTRGASTPAVIDISLMRPMERSRFFADFAESLFRHCRRPLHLVIDECHLFMPQGATRNPQSARMLSAANHLVSGGRSRGLRIMLISQRPAKVHKDSLTQVEALIAMRLIAPHDQKAIADWLKYTPARENFVGKLAALPTGTGIVYAPELDYLETVAFPRIRTLDTMSGPVAGLEPKRTTDDLAARELSAELFPAGPAAGKAPGKTPKAARSSQIEPDTARITELERLVEHQRRRIRFLERTIVQARDARRDLMTRVTGLQEATAAMSDLFAAALNPESDRSGAPVSAPDEPGTKSNGNAPDPSAAPAASQDATEPFTATLLDDPLVVLARSIWPVELTWPQLCAMAGRKARGGHFNRTRKALLDAGVVRMNGDLVALTYPPEIEEGALPADVLARNLPQPARKMFIAIRESLIGLSVEELAEELQMTPRGGHWNRGLSLLRQNGLIVEAGGRIEIHPKLEQRAVTWHTEP